MVAGCRRLGRAGRCRGSCEFGQFGIALEQSTCENFENNGAVWNVGVDKPLASRALTAPAGTRWDFQNCNLLSANVERVGKGTATARVRWIVTSRIGGEFLGPALTLLPLNDKGVVNVHLQADQGELTPVGHQRPWDALAAAEIVALELRVEASFAQKLDHQLDLRISKVSLDSGRASSAARQIVDFASAAAAGGQPSGG